MFESNHKGAVAEAKIAAEALRLGIPVLKPLAEHGRYDLAFDLESRILRVQCKWGSFRKGVIQARVGGSWHSPTRGYVTTTYDSSEIDVVAIYAGELDACFAVPVSLIEGQRVLYLRVDPPENHQRGAINWADEYALGAVAQLAERSAGSRKVGGSNPPSSTQGAPDAPPPAEVVGAHEFRNLFGWFMQRAAAGEEFLVTRRGKPFARLSPSDAQLPLHPPIRLPLVSVEQLVSAHRDEKPAEEGGEPAPAAA